MPIFHKASDLVGINFAWAALIAVAALCFKIPDHATRALLLSGQLILTPILASICEEHAEEWDSIKLGVALGIAAVTIFTARLFYPI